MHDNNLGKSTTNNQTKCQMPTDVQLVGSKRYGSCAAFYQLVTSKHRCWPQAKFSKMSLVICGRAGPEKAWPALPLGAPGDVTIDIN